MKLYSFIALIYTTELVTSQGEWRRVLKINKGKGFTANGESVDEWYNRRNSVTYTNMNNEESYLSSSGSLLTVENTNFKSLLIQEWQDNKINVNKVRLSFCKNNAIQKQIVFNAVGATYNDWLTISRIESSSWSDLTSSTSISNTNWIGISSGWNKRSFVIWKYADTCPVDEGWFIITTWATICDTEWGEGVTVPSIHYINTDTATRMQTNGVAADTFIMEILLPTTNPTPVPTDNPTPSPTNNPTIDPTVDPTMDPTIDPTIVPTFEPTLIPTTYPTIQPTYNPTSVPSMVPTRDPTGNPSATPTVRPTTECSNDRNAVLKIAFDYELENDATSKDEIETSLEKAAGVFVEEEIDDKTDCTVSDYSLSIKIDDNLEDAHINASICFNCNDGEKLNINIGKTELERDFIKTVQQETTVLTVKTVNEIEVDTVNEGGVIDTTTTTIMITNDGKKDNGTTSFFDDVILIPFLGATIAILSFIVCCVFIIYYRRRNSDKQNKENMQNGMELARVVTYSEHPNVSKHESIDITQHSIVETPMGMDGDSRMGTGTGSSPNDDPLNTLGIDINNEQSEEINIWLNNIGLLQYYQIFTRHGFGDDISKLNRINDTDLKNMGINKMAHRKAIILQITNNRLKVQVNTGDMDDDIGEDLGVFDDDDGEDLNEMYRDKTDVTPNAASNGLNGDTPTGTDSIDHDEGSSDDVDDDELYKRRNQLTKQ